MVKSNSLTIKQLNKARATFQDHVNEGSFEPGHMDRCGYCQACVVAITLIDKELANLNGSDYNYVSSRTIY